MKRAVEQLGIKYGTLAEWRKLRNRASAPKAEGSLAELTYREIQLMKENKELKDANEILKDELGFFVKDRK